MDETKETTGATGATGEQTVDTSNVVVTTNSSGTTTAEIVGNNDHISQVLDNKETTPQETTGETNSNYSNSETLEADVQGQQKAETDVKEDLAAKGVDFDKIAQEYDTNGSLSTESLESLEKAGYPKSVVAAYIKGLEATTERFVSQVKGMAGGEDGFSKLSSFIAQQPKEVIDAFNSTISSGNLTQIQLAISGLQAQMTKAYGTSNPTLMAGAAGNSTSNGYMSYAEMVKDMSDPRYQNDPVFTQEVIRKVNNATFF